MPEVIELAERVLNAFKRYECFIFEAQELQSIRELVAKSELTGLVVVRRVDPRYEHLYILAPWSLDFEKECLSLVQNMLAEGRLSLNDYKRKRDSLIEQCIVSKERERVRVIIEKLENYIKSIKGS
ncbi:hypothetical protein ACSU1N_00760 [Thermogladius sp. 4427co]|uniref:hypothetical protein n=1 Tax=Thermogladius sp. 4427co TaxID=3450718 RepID=UPI003F7A9F05